MFYAQFVLCRKGPLARIWLAAHWDKHLTRRQICDTSIENSVDDILQPKVKMALRTSGHLLLGVVRIYSRKAKYLLSDCNEAFIKLKMAFRSDSVDLPAESSVAAFGAITLKEVFYNFDSIMPDSDDLQPALNQSKIEEITMREENYDDLVFFYDDGFGDEDAEIDREVSQVNNSLRNSGLQYSANKDDRQSFPELENNANISLDIPFDFVGERNFYVNTGSLHQLNDLFDKSSMENVSINDHVIGDNNAIAESTANDDPTEHIENEEVQIENTVDEPTVLIRNIDETFVLAPLDASSGRKRKRRRKLIIDKEKHISGEKMKAQAEDQSSILTTLDLAPPNKLYMQWKERENMFAFPGRNIPSNVLSKLFQRHLNTRSVETEDFDSINEEEEEIIESDQEEELMQILHNEIVQDESVTTPNSARKTSSRCSKRRKDLDDTSPVGPNKRIRKSSPEVARRCSSITQPEIDLQQSHLIDSCNDDFSRGSPVLDMQIVQSPLAASRIQEIEDEIECPQRYESSFVQDSGETYAEYEERIRNKRTKKIFRKVKNCLRTQREVLFNELVVGNSRKEVARKFYSVLVLKKQQAVELTQKSSFSDIYITRGSKFDTICY